MLHEIMEIILNTCNICEAYDGDVFSSCAEENCPIFLIEEKVQKLIQEE